MPKECGSGMVRRMHLIRASPCAECLCNTKRIHNASAKFCANYRMLYEDDECAYASCIISSYEIATMTENQHKHKRTQTQFALGKRNLIAFVQNVGDAGFAERIGKRIVQKKIRKRTHSISPYRHATYPHYNFMYYPES